jgi:L-lactate dehydrogenase complex protein LldG
VTGSKANRKKVLESIRTALGTDAPDLWREMNVRQRLMTHPSGTIPARSLGNRDARLALFSGMLVNQGADVARVRDPEGVVKAIAAYLAKHELPTELRLSEEPVLVTLPWLLAPKLTQTCGEPSASDAIGLSRAIAGVAETGTLFLVSGAGNPTSLNFLPETHIVMVDEGDIVGAYEEAWGRLRALYGEGTLPRTGNWISGPSRTADIEQTIIRGAHGPKRLFVVILDEQGL